jgi:hypothetical protein
MTTRGTVLLLLIFFASAAPDATENEVVIQADSLDPPLLQVVPDQKVVFVNRSGRSVQLDFVGDANQHHVFRVSGTIWAIFHRQGKHPYTIHFDDQHGALLRGVIDVTRGSLLESPPTCSTVTVMGACLEP